MEEKKTGSITSGSCQILGKDLKQALKELKVAFPRKKPDKERTFVQITGLSEGLSFGLPGARGLATAEISNRFKVIIPWNMFKPTFVLPWKAAEIIKLEFSNGCLKINDVATFSPKIIFQSVIENNSIDENSKTEGGKPESKVRANPVIPDPLDSPLGLPLLGAYVYRKKYGVPPFLANTEFIGQLNEIERVLERATRTLKPTGITREDLERLIDKKIGLRDPDVYKET